MSEARDPCFPPGASLVRRCRQALCLSAAGLAARLHVSSGRVVRSWEAGEHAIPGPAWVALRYMMAEHGARDLEFAIVDLLEREAA